MGRAAGKHHAPRVDAQQVDPDSPRGRELGMSDRVQGTPSPIPGGENHITNAQTFRQRVPVPDDKPETPDQNAHGVPPGTHLGFSRAQLMRGKLANQPADVYFTPTDAPPRPVPVYIVEEDRNTVYRAAAPRTILLNAAGGDPVHICGRDPKRAYVMLLNEDSTHNIRFAQLDRDLTVDEGGVETTPTTVGGALLPAASNSYTRIATQDHLWAISADSGTPRISVIQVFDTEGTGL